MRLHWEQLELRNNVRNALKEQGYFQRHLAEKLDITRNQMTGLFSGQGWSREQVEVAATFLGISADELIGDSTFTRKVVDPKARTPIIDKGDRLRALCCECGTLRTVAKNWARGDHDALYEKGSNGRMVSAHKCTNCGTTTRHAILREDDEYADLAEDADHAPTANAQSLRERDALIERMRGFNVVVSMRGGRWSKRSSEAPVVGYAYDESKSQWRFEVASAAPPRVQLEILRQAWKEVATGEFGEDMTWDPKEGVWTYGSSDAWSVAADELVTDLNRFMEVERRRLVQSINDEIVRSEYSIGERKSQ